MSKRANDFDDNRAGKRGSGGDLPSDQEFDQSSTGDQSSQQASADVLANRTIKKPRSLRDRLGPKALQNSANTSSTTPISGFSFGNSVQAKPMSAFSFTAPTSSLINTTSANEPTSKPDSENLFGNSIFKGFGASAEGSAPTSNNTMPSAMTSFTFGAPASKTEENDKPKPTPAFGFSFGSSAPSKETATEKPAFSFGAFSNLQKSNVSTKLDAPTIPQFGTLSAEKKDSTETPGFSIAQTHAPSFGTFAKSQANEPTITPNPPVFSFGGPGAQKGVPNIQQNAAPVNSGLFSISAPADAQKKEESGKLATSPELKSVSPVKGDDTNAMKPPIFSFSGLNAPQKVDTKLDTAATPFGAPFNENKNDLIKKAPMVPFGASLSKDEKNSANITTTTPFAFGSITTKADTTAIKTPQFFVETTLESNATNKYPISKTEPAISQSSVPDSHPSLLGEGSVIADTTMADVSTVLDVPTNTVAKETIARKEKLFKHLRALNIKLLKHMENHLKTDELCDFTQAFELYLRRRRELTSEYQDVISTAPSSTVSPKFSSTSLPNSQGINPPLLATSISSKSATAMPGEASNDKIISTQKPKGFAPFVPRTETQDEAVSSFKPISLEKAKFTPFAPPSSSITSTTLSENKTTEKESTETSFEAKPSEPAKPAPLASFSFGIPVNNSKTEVTKEAGQTKITFGAKPAQPTVEPEKSESSTSFTFGTTTEPKANAFGFTAPVKSQFGLSNTIKDDAPAKSTTSSGFTFGASTPATSGTVNPSSSSGFFFGIPATDNATESGRSAFSTGFSFGSIKNTSLEGKSPSVSSRSAGAPSLFSAGTNLKLSEEKPAAPFSFGTAIAETTKFAPPTSTSTASSAIEANKSTPVLSSKQDGLKFKATPIFGNSSPAQEGTLPVSESTQPSSTGFAAKSGDTPSSLPLSAVAGTTAIEKPSNASDTAQKEGPTSQQQEETENAPVPASPPRTELVSRGDGEESEETVHSVRCILFKFKEKEKGGDFANLGIGLFKVNEDNETRKRRILIRAERTGKLLMNTYFYPGMKFKMNEDNSRVFISFGLFEEGKIQRYLVRIKKKEDAEELLDILNKSVDS
ncbi:uncharacterized protein VTP21DRAFT_5459 [Calcarisporiella thermophila]|uniref:uncharacterized protein n=1 Tax=Calcarisporiella thermophila TaxID=911321 RepID=UPI003742AC1C